MLLGFGYLSLLCFISFFFFFSQKAENIYLKKAVGQNPVIFFFGVNSR